MSDGIYQVIAYWFEKKAKKRELTALEFVYYRIRKDKNQRTEKKTWKERIIENFGKNPIKCSKCDNEMELWEIWSAKYGTIYHMLDDLKYQREAPQ